MKLKLQEICRVQMGYSFRSRLERTVSDSCIRVIQMKDISESGHLIKEDIFCIEMKDIKSGYLLNKGDIIFKSRGNLNTAALVSEDLGKTIAASPLTVLKVKGKNVLPAYLAWYINQPAAQKQLESKAGGTSVRMINIADLGALEVPIPPIETQKKIISISELFQREQALMLEVALKRKKLYETLFTRIINSKIKEAGGFYGKAAF